MKGQQFLLVVDNHYKWMEVFPLTCTTANDTIEALRALFVRYGLPHELVVWFVSSTCYLRRHWLECFGRLKRTFCFTGVIDVRSESIRVDLTRTGGPDFCTCLAKMFVCPVPKISHVMMKWCRRASHLGRFTL